MQEVERGGPAQKKRRKEKKKLATTSELETFLRPILKGAFSPFFCPNAEIFMAVRLQ